MNRQTLPRALFTTLVAVAAAARPAAALPPTPPADTARPELVDERTLAQVSGKYYGADMLVGLRINLVSRVATPDGGSALANGTLSIQRNDGGGYTVRVDTGSQALAGSGAGTAPDASATSAHGGDGVQVAGISQVAQIAGDGNRLGNIALISFAPAGTDTGSYNGVAQSEAGAGDLSARVSFLDGGLRVSVAGGGASLGQRIDTGGGIAQFGQIAGNGLAGSNLLQLTLATRATPVQQLQQMGVTQALAGLAPLGR